MAVESTEHIASMILRHCSYRREVRYAQNTEVVQFENSRRRRSGPLLASAGARYGKAAQPSVPIGYNTNG